MAERNAMNMTQDNSQMIIMAGNLLDLSIYIIINKTCTALRSHKCIIDPLGPPKIMYSLWLYKIPFWLLAKSF